MILITFTLHDLLMLLGENWCWSLLGPKGLMEEEETFKYMGRQGSFYGNWGVEASPPPPNAELPPKYIVIITVYK